MNPVEAASAPAGVASLPASIPVRRDAGAEASGPVGDAAWLVVAVLIVALVAAVFVARRRTSAAKGLPPEVERVSSTRLSPRHSLHVVVWNGRRLLVGCTDQSMQLLAEAPAASATPPRSAS